MFFHIKQFVIFLFVFLVALPVFAEEEAASPNDPWDGSNASFGLIVDTGNSDDVDGNGGLDLHYSGNKWSNNFQATAELSRSEGDVTKEKYFLQNQSNHSFGVMDANYYFLNTNFTEDKFSAYRYRFVLASGYGRKVINTDQWMLSVQAGPGIRHNREADTRDTNTHTVLTTGSNLIWHITETATFSEALTYDIGSPYDYLKSVAAISNKIIHNLAVRIACSLEYYSQIPEYSSNTKKTDTTTTVALVYRF